MTDPSYAHTAPQASEEPAKGLAGANAETELYQEQAARLVAFSVREIKVCPFCGQKARFSRDGVCHRIGCKNADCPVQPVVEMDLKNSRLSEVLTAWNTRAAE